MNPIEFPEQNSIYRKDQKGVQPLPAHKADDPNVTVVTCWELSDEELERVNKSGVIYLTQMTGGKPLQPVFVTGKKDDIFEEQEADLKVEPKDDE